MAQLFRSFILSVFFQLAHSAEDRSCYYLDGSVADSHVPCTTNSVTNCCNSKDICLSNGLCYLQGSQGLSLSRGTCTDQSWGSDCYAPCSNYRRNTGMPIMNIAYNYSSTNYCCGAAIADNGDVGCKYEEPFTLTEATVIPGVAYLENNSAGVSTSSTSSPSSSSCVAVEAGVSIPLGVIAIVSVIWALSERHRRRNTQQALPNNLEGNNLLVGSHPIQAAELNVKQGVFQMPELMDTRREYTEAPCD